MKVSFRISQVVFFTALLFPLLHHSSLIFPDDSQSAGSLPRVLIIGDSISIGYTPEVKKILASKAVVLHNPGNAQHTGTGMKKIDNWLGEEKWQVIHFNWGLWDLCYRAKGGGMRRDKASGKITHSLGEYRLNLEKLVLRLKKTGARLIWASTTLVPEGEAGRKVGDDLRYNAVAQAVMKKHGVAINDLNEVSRKIPAELFRAPGDVHFKPAGRRILALEVAKRIEEMLGKDKPAPSR